MVKYNATNLDTLFHALADPTRRSMLQALALQSRSIGELAEPFDMSLAAASKHIRVLEQASLINRKVQGRSHICELNAAPMHGGLEWIQHYQRYWNQQLDTLEQLLSKPESN
ncbi:MULTISPECIES: metalloregulator ArsR/SmtB family transcription factor [unclassified Methylophaga]|jgi:DNA-binding transcriptional ArsR family regulator|uniref:ArsR/SmtB family transcription factor n=1 Tax=unclassified Methylophaga TaxID=2629249 RepID=UPI000C8D502F|nr:MULTISPECIES: metalloregulator ArsR/SmtB family transcription factor [unclassified Methylophaga]MAK67793.1 transcriptional regulator [Methylophaga sp.]MAY18474.1 transcriptional regulator [Methylophaga sp.]MBN45897.1 transcriptional regulator [Methylophaga sp.]HAO24015.1 transcriptional regulator [Methylophaga sp.]HCD04971.1 transcriptional regulator [Methylophaga sp.]|tara:strand:+ start:9966 stop:10301 length:336 start_codon:yes stop_codon:yes gene_type:complete